MPSPVGHTLSVCVVLPILGRNLWEKKSGLRFVAASVFAANSPDIDFLAGFLAGAPNRFHHQITHSFFFALIMGLLFGLLFSNGKREKKISSEFPRLFTYFSCLASLHLILDLFCADTTAPFGLMFFWPLSLEYFIAPVSLFSDIRRSSDVGNFIPSLFSLHNGLAVVRETAVLTGLYLITWSAKIRAQKFLLHSRSSLP